MPTRRLTSSRAFDDGPAHVVVLDSGEDKADATNVYAGLNQVEPYRKRELAWWQAHVAAEPRARRPAPAGRSVAPYSDGVCQGDEWERPSAGRVARVPARHDRRAAVVLCWTCPPERRPEAPSRWAKDCSNRCTFWSSV
jgi:hypothetical protein